MFIIDVYRNLPQANCRYPPGNHDPKTTHVDNGGNFRRYNIKVYITISGREVK